MKNHNQYNGGIADVWYSGNSDDLWIEYKFITVPLRGLTIIDLVSPKGKKQESVISALQQEWLISRHREGRNVGVIVGCKAGGVWFPGTAWHAIYTADDFKAKLVSRKELAQIITTITDGRTLPDSSRAPRRSRDAEIDGDDPIKATGSTRRVRRFVPVR